MRVATAGLAASESTMPVIISTAIAASSIRSTVHHHSANRVRSTREIMESPAPVRMIPKSYVLDPDRGWAPVFGPDHAQAV